MTLSERRCLDNIKELEITEEELEKYGFIVQVIFDNTVKDNVVLAALKDKFNKSLEKHIYKGKIDQK